MKTIHYFTLPLLLLTAGCGGTDDDLESSTSSASSLIMQSSMSTHASSHGSTNMLHAGDARVISINTPFTAQEDDTKVTIVQDVATDSRQIKVLQGSILLGK